MFRHALFEGNDLHIVFRRQQTAALDEIEKYNEDKLLSSSPDDLCTYLILKYAVEPLVLDKAGIVAAQEETRTPSQYNLDFAYGRPDPNGKPAVKISFRVPFAGEPDLFSVIPPSFNSAIHIPDPPHGRMRREEAVLEVCYVHTHGFNAEYGLGRHADESEIGSAIRAKFDRDLEKIDRRIADLHAAVDERNRHLASKIREGVLARRQQLLKTNSISAALGFPLRRRDDAAAETFAVPAIRKRLPLPPPAGDGPFKSEPTIEMRAYESVLSTISNLSIAMERSPSAFKNMEEEHIRDLIVVILNTVYEGQRATGETFNFGGRSDILIRGDDGNNLFVGECKVWSGQKNLLEAVDQLLRYVTWRDTKAALLVFNRNSNFGGVLDTIQDTLPRHSQFKRAERYTAAGETGFRFILHRPDDPSREVILTVLAFDVPTG